MLKPDVQLHSSGVFTLDPEMLRKTYRNLLKATPDLYLCKLFQAAVSTKSQRFELEFTRRRLLLRWDRPIDKDNQHLAQAQLLASTRSDLKITREDQCSMEVTSSRWSLPLASLKWPEFLYWKARLGFHPGHLSINGQLVPVGQPGNLATHAHFSKYPEAGAVGLDLTETAAVYSFEGDASGRCVQYINLNANVGVSNPYSLHTHYSDDVLVLVSDGLPVYRTNHWLGKVGIFMVVANNRLPTDASTLTLVEGPELQAAIEKARHDAEQFLLCLEERFPPDSNPQLAGALRAMRSLPR